MSIIPFPKRSFGGAEAQGSPGAVGFATLDDDAVMAKVVAGEIAAFDELIRRYWRPLTAYASRILGDRDAGNDAAQTAFIHLWQRRADWRPGSLHAYLIRLTRNLCVDHLRSDAVRARLAGAVREVLTTPARTPADELDDEELRISIDEAIQALSPRRREVFILAYLRGFTYREVAEISGTSVRTVSKQIVAALEQLRKVLRPVALGDGVDRGGGE